MKQCKNKVRDMHIVERKYINSGNRRQHNISTLVSMFDVAVVYSTYLFFILFDIAAMRFVFLLLFE